MAYQIKQLSDLHIVLNKMHAIVPIFSTSCVTGEGLDLQRQFEFLVEDKFNVSGIGLVASGFVS
jgi:GTPase